MIEAAVDQNQVQEWVPVEIGLDASNVGSLITLPKTVWIYQKKEKEQSEQIQQMPNLEKNKTAVKVPVADTYENLFKVTSQEI